MIYQPDWEPLGDVLKHVMDANPDTNELQAKLSICCAMADRNVDVRVHIDRADPTVGGKVYSGWSVDIPPRLSPDDLDWIASRPLKPMRIGYFTDSLHSIELLELRTADVITFLCRRTRDDARPNSPPQKAVGLNKELAVVVHRVAADIAPDLAEPKPHLPSQALTRDQAIHELLSGGTQPGKTVSWKAFNDLVRDESDGWTDKAHGKMKRGWGGKMIGRAVQRIRKKLNDRDKSDI